MQLMLSIALSAALAVPQDSVAQSRTFALPDDPRAVVLSYDWPLLWGERPPERPFLEVRADGTLVAPDRSGGSTHLVDRLDPEELQALLRFVVDEHHLLEFRATDVAAKVPRRRKSLRMCVQTLPGPTVAVAVDLPAHRVVATYTDARAVARRYPEIEELVSFAAVEARLEGLSTQLWLGGRERASELLAVVNEQLAAEDPELAPLTWDDVPTPTVVGRAVRMISDPLSRERCVQLERVERDGSRLVARLRVPGDGEPSVRIELERP